MDKEKFPQEQYEEHVNALTEIINLCKIKTTLGTSDSGYTAAEVTVEGTEINRINFTTNGYIIQLNVGDYGRNTRKLTSFQLLPDDYNRLYSIFYKKSHIYFSIPDYLLPPHLKRDKKLKTILN